MNHTYHLITLSNVLEPWGFVLLKWSYASNSITVNDQVKLSIGRLYLNIQYSYANEVRVDFM